MSGEKELKEKMRNFYWNLCYKKEQITRELNLSLAQVEDYIGKFKLEIWRMIPWKSEKLSKLSDDAQRLLRALIHLTRDSDPNSRPLSRRDEANVLTCSAFRNGYLEELHTAPASKISEEGMKKLMIESSGRLEEWLEIRDAFLPERPDIYFALVQVFRDAWTKDWEQVMKQYEMKEDKKD